MDPRSGSRPDLLTAAPVAAPWECDAVYAAETEEELGLVQQSRDWVWCEEKTIYIIQELLHLASMRASCSLTIEGFCSRLSVTFKHVIEQALNVQRNKYSI